MTNFVDTPQIGHVYLIRRRLGGLKAARFQPAKVIDRKPSLGGQFDGHFLKVRWLTDNVEQDDVFQVSGTVKELTYKWIRDELIRADGELRAAKVSFDNLTALKMLHEMRLTTDLPAKTDA